MSTFLDLADKKIYDQVIRKTKNKIKKVVVYTIIPFITFFWFSVYIALLHNTHKIEIANSVENGLVFVSRYFSVFGILLALVLLYYMTFRWWPIQFIPWIEVLIQNDIDVNENLRPESGESRLHAGLYRRRKLYVLIRSFIKSKYQDKPSYHLIDANGNLMTFHQHDSSLDKEYKGYIFNHNIQSSLIRDLKIMNKFLPMRRVKYLFGIVAIFSSAFLLTFMIEIKKPEAFVDDLYFYIIFSFTFFVYFTSIFIAVYYDGVLNSERLSAILGSGYPEPMLFSPRIYPKLVEIVEKGFPFINL